MKKYAQILNGLVHYIFESATTPVFAPNIVWVILPNNTEVKVGWSYNNVTGEFTPPPEPEPYTPPKTAVDVALEIQEQQNTDTLIMFDGLATTFEDVRENSIIQMEVMATVFETLIGMQFQIDDINAKVE